MKTYKQQLQEWKEISEKQKLFLYQIEAAYSVESVFDEGYCNDEQFEQVCEYVYDYIMNSSMGADDLCNILWGALQGSDDEPAKITLQDFDDDWDKINEVVYVLM